MMSSERSHSTQGAALVQKTALVSCSIPPSTWGQAIMLHRLFGGFSPEELCVISCDPDHRIPTIDSATFRLPGRYYSTRKELEHPAQRSAPHQSAPTHAERKPRRPSRLRIGLGFAREVRRCAERIVEILRSERCEAVVGCTGEIHEFPAAYWAARRFGVPFFAYAFDYYSCQFQTAFAASPRYLTHLERYILRRSAGVLVPNELLRDIFRRRYNVESVVIRNPLDEVTSRQIPTAAATDDNSSLRIFDQADAERGESSRELRIVYTGSVYDAQFDAFRNLIVALDQLRRPELKLHIYTNHTPAYLAAGGIRGPFIQHPAVSAAEAIELQRDADILFLPLAFSCPYPEIVQTAAPSKLGEYLAAGRPILAHAPPDSFVAWYFRQHRCGLLIDRPEPALLGKAVENLLSDRALRSELVRNALRCAAEFHIDVARATLRTALHLPPHRRAA